MQSKPDDNSLPAEKPLHLYEYAIIRLMPDVERGEQLNVGLAMMCKRRRWLRVEIDFDPALAARLAPACELDAVARQLDAFVEVASGRSESPIAELDAHERFRWLTAVRSACIVTSRPHPGKTPDLDATFNRLFERLVKH
ncbi:MAG: DUF3037 domain-containing protein [Muribaculaceae bacterium]|nr:DUF3037 domain-containing protein [Muribaculaceae bacterium]